MKARVVLAVWCGLLLSAKASTGQEAYPIVLRKAGVGETTRHEDALITRILSQEMTESGNVVEQQESDLREVVYHETLLPPEPAGQVTRMSRRQCERAVLSKNGKEAVLPYHGKTFVVRQFGPIYAIDFEGASPPVEFVTEMVEAFNKQGERPDLSALLVPPRAVRPGDSWGLAVAPILNNWIIPWDLSLDHDAATGVAKLVRVYEKDGRRFGVLEGRVEVPVLGVTNGPRASTVLPETRMVTRIVLDACIDGSASTSELRLTQEIIVRLEVAGPSGRPIHLTLSDYHSRMETRK